jgi:segregation and condensation protein B
VPVVLDASQMESIIESLLFASDKVLGLAELKRLLGERDGKKVTAAVEALLERRRGSGIEVVRLASGWHLRTNPEHARWVTKLLAGRPMRLSRAMMETLAIVAYRQPVTRPEVDEIRGVDCGPVLKTLLDRALIRIIGKKEEVGRPLLYGTTPEFLRVFSLGELSDLPTLREYAELSSEQQARVEAEHGPAPEATSAEAAGAEAGAGAAPGAAPTAYNLNFVARSELPEEPEETDPLLDELESASKVASKILGAVSEPAAEEAATEPEPTPVPPPGEPTNGS